MDSELTASDNVDVGHPAGVFRARVGLDEHGVGEHTHALVVHLVVEHVARLRQLHVPLCILTRRVLIAAHCDVGSELLVRVTVDLSGEGFVYQRNIKFTV